MKKLLIALVLFSSCERGSQVSRGTYFQENDFTIHYYYKGIHYVKPKGANNYINFTQDSMYQEYNLQEEVNRTYPFDHSRILITSK